MQNILIFNQLDKFAKIEVKFFKIILNGWKFKNENYLEITLIPISSSLILSSPVIPLSVIR